uniref:Chitinase n=1 Tax=Romanomermis culicivorax TaxID=13658 RepID=A0A915INQ1_ROMCU
MALLINGSDTVLSSFFRKASEFWIRTVPLIESLTLRNGYTFEPTTEYCTTIGRFNFRLAFYILLVFFCFLFVTLIFTCYGLISMAKRNKMKQTTVNNNVRSCKRGKESDKKYVNKRKPEFEAPPEKAVDNPLDPDLFTFEGDTGELTHQGILNAQKQKKSKKPKSSGGSKTKKHGEKPTAKGQTKNNAPKRNIVDSKPSTEPDFKINVSSMIRAWTYLDRIHLTSSLSCKPPKTKEGKKYIRGCYYTNWAQDRTCKVQGLCDPPDAIYFPEDYVPNLCTHIFFAFVETNDKQEIVTTRENDREIFKRLNKLKKKQPDLKLLVSLGGWGFCKGEPVEDNRGNQILNKLVANSDSRKRFIKNALDFVLSNKFDGFDWDWEYPEAAQRNDFATLLKEMYDVFHGKGLLLVAAVPFIQDRFVGYDVKSLAEYLDFINIMSYDMHGTWSWDHLGHNSPLYCKDKLDVAHAAQNWVDHGFPKNKLIIGLASYGRSWKVSDLKSAKSGARVGQGASSPGIYTNAKGFESYYEICQKISSNVIRKKNIVVDSDEKVPYAVYSDTRDGPTFTGYDDQTSIQRKLRWLMKKGYGGAFFWTLDMDDFSGELCENSPHPYPLISQMAQVFDSANIQPMKKKKNNKRRKDRKKSVAKRSVTPPPPVSNSKKFDPSYDPARDGCQKKSGNLFNPKDCSTYYVCIPEHPIYLQHCPATLVFDGENCNTKSDCKAVV